MAIGRRFEVWFNMAGFPVTLEKGKVSGSSGTSEERDAIGYSIEGP